MITKIISGTEAVIEGAKLINCGEVVAFPTETVYGLGADALNPDAVDKIFKAKNRPADNPLIVHIHDKNQISLLTAEVNEDEQKIIDAFMPGPLSLVMRASGKVPKSVTAGLSTVAVRMPANQVAQSLLKNCKNPVAAPSANLSTRVSPTTAQDVSEDMDGRIPLIIDGGACSVGIESTVLTLAGGTPSVLRPGAVTPDMISEVLGKEVRMHDGRVAGVPQSPGMKYRHYAPANDTVIAASLQSAEDAYFKVSAEGKRAVILDLGREEDKILKNLYRELRKADREYDYIIVVDFGGQGKLAAAKNRILKAAGGRII